MLGQTAGAIKADTIEGMLADELLNKKSSLIESGGDAMRGQLSSRYVGELFAAYNIPETAESTAAKAVFSKILAASLKALGD